MTTLLSRTNEARKALRLRWGLFAGLCLAFLASGTAVLYTTLSPASAVRWLILAAAILFYLLQTLWTGLEQNYRPGEVRLLPGLGPGNLLTLLRGVMIAGLAGFLLSPRPAGWLAWVPGGLYALAVLADFLDGWAARASNHATRLGEILDLSLDGAGVLAAGLLAVQYGQAPGWYLLVPFARYLFIGGLWLRQRLGKPSFDLPHNPGRRGLAGVQMGFLAVVLLPLFGPPGTHLAAAAFALPFLAGFGRDWLFASGTLRPAFRQTARWPMFSASVRSHWLPVGLRLAVLLLSAAPLAAAWLSLAGAPRGSSLSQPGLPLVLFETFTVLLVLSGTAGRAASIAGLFTLGIHQLSAGLSPAQSVLVLVYTALLFLGTGTFSIWKPEERLIYHRAGEAGLREAG